MNRTTHLITFLIILSMFGCGRTEQNGVRIAVGAEGGSYYSIGQTLAAHWREDLKKHVTAVSGDELTGILNCRELLSGKVDFAIMQDEPPNDSLVDAKSIRTAMPLYPTVLLIIYKQGLHPKSLRDLVVGRRVTLGPSTSGTAMMVRRLLMHYGIDTTQWTLVYSDYNHKQLSDSVPVLFWLTGLDNPRIVDILAREGGVLYSLDTVGTVGFGSSVEGFCLNYRYARPFILPKNAFGEFPIQPIVTLASDVVLVTRKDVDKYLVYDLVKSIMDHKQTLANSVPALSNLNEVQNTNTLSYPLHMGAIMYLRRNDPSFVDRYADLIGVVVSLIAAIAGFVSALIGWSNAKKRKRLEVYLKDIVEFEGKINSFASLDELREAFTKLVQYKQDAVQQLVSGKQSPDESYIIFLNLLNNAINLVQLKIDGYK